MIKVEGSFVGDIIQQLGLTSADIRIGFHTTDRGKPRFTVEARGGPYTFFKVKQVAAHVAGLCMAYEMHLLAKERKEAESLKKLYRGARRGGKKRTLRPNTKRRTRTSLNPR